MQQVLRLFKGTGGRNSTVKKKAFRQIIARLNCEQQDFGCLSQCWRQQSRTRYRQVEAHDLEEGYAAGIRCSVTGVTSRDGQGNQEAGGFGAEVFEIGWITQKQRHIYTKTAAIKKCNELGKEVNRNIFRGVYDCCRYWISKEETRIGTKKAGTAGVGQQGISRRAGKDQGN